MKKYSIFDLYVVKIEEYYFICEKTYKENTYKEIFTKEEFKVLDIENIKPLKNYYSLFEIQNYKTGAELKLTKKALLIRYAQINSAQIERRKQHNNNEDLIKGMDNYLFYLKELAKNDPEKAKEEAIASLCGAGILKENMEFKDNYTSLICEENNYKKVLIRKNSVN